MKNKGFEMNNEKAATPIWWKVQYSYGVDITPVAVSKETSATLVLVVGSGNEGAKQRRYSVRKQCNDTTYFQSWDEAHVFALDKAQRKLNNARFMLERVEGVYANLKGMKMPDISKLLAALEHYQREL